MGFAAWFFPLLCLTGAAAAQQPPGPAADAGDRRFDGTWNVTVTCPTHTDGALGYTYEFPAQVKNGRLRGENGQEGRANWLRLEGTIPSEGDTTLRANGLTGEQVYAAGQVHKSTPYSYRVRAHFDATRGSGKRIEVRACELTFVKQ